MAKHDLFEIFERMPKKVNIGDITIRDGFQHEEHFIPTRAKAFYLHELAFAGVKKMEVTNLGNPRNMPQFNDAEELLKSVHSDIFKKRLKKRNLNHSDIEWTCITIRESAVDRAIELKEKGYGPDRILMMVSTDAQPPFGKLHRILKFGGAGYGTAPDGAHRSAHLDAGGMAFFDATLGLFPVLGQSTA